MTTQAAKPILRLCIYCGLALNKKTAWRALRNGGNQSACKKCSLVQHRFFNWTANGPNRVCEFIDEMSERLKQMKFFVRHPGLSATKLMQLYVRERRAEKRMEVRRPRKARGERK